MIQKVDNRKKTIFIWIFGVVLVMLLFPPWIDSRLAGKQTIRDNIGYSFILDQPNGKNVSIDWSKLIIQFAVVACVTGIAIFSNIHLAKIGIAAKWLMAFASFLFIVVWLFHYFTEVRPYKQVKMSIKYEPDKCSIEYPMLVTTNNNGSKTVSKISFEIAVRIPGHSNNLVPLNVPMANPDKKFITDYSTDIIVMSGTSSTTCYRHPFKTFTEITALPEFSSASTERQQKVISLAMEDMGAKGYTPEELSYSIEREEVILQ